MFGYIEKPYQIEKVGKVKTLCVEIRKPNILGERYISIYGENIDYLVFPEGEDLAYDGMVDEIFDWLTNEESLIKIETIEDIPYREIIANHHIGKSKDGSITMY